MHSAPKVNDLKDAEMNSEFVDPFKYPLISICLHIGMLSDLSSTEHNLFPVTRLDQNFECWLVGKHFFTNCFE